MSAVLTPAAVSKTHRRRLYGPSDQSVIRTLTNRFRAPFASLARPSSSGAINGSCVAAAADQNHLPHASHMPPRRAAELPSCLYNLRTNTGHACSHCLARDKPAFRPARACTAFSTSLRGGTRRVRASLAGAAPTTRRQVN